MLTHWNNRRVCSGVNERTTTLHDMNKSHNLSKRNQTQYLASITTFCAMWYFLSIFRGLDFGYQNSEDAHVP